MKYLLCFFMFFGLLINGQAQSTISYGKTTQKKIISKLSKDSKLLAQLNELKMDPKTQTIFINMMSTIGAMNTEDRVYIGSMCIECMLHAGLLSKKEYYLMKELFDSRGTSKSAVKKLRNIDKYSNIVAAGAIIGGVAAVDSGATGQGFWKAVLKVIGAIVGGGGGAVIGGGGGAAGGAIAGAPIAGVGAGPGAILGGISGGSTGLLAGAGIGAGIGETVGEAIDEYQASSNEPGGVVARPDGKDCTGFPISF